MFSSQFCRNEALNSVLEPMLGVRMQICVFVCVVTHCFSCASYCRKDEAEEENFISVPSSSATSGSSSGKKSPKPSRLVDLGAAATFGVSSKQQQAAAPQPSKGSSDIDNLFGDFSSQPVQQQQQPQQPQTGGAYSTLSPVLKIVSICGTRYTFTHCSCYVCVHCLSVSYR